MLYGIILSMTIWGLHVDVEIFYVCFKSKSIQSIRKKYKWNITSSWDKSLQTMFKKCDIFDFSVDLMNEYFLFFVSTLIKHLN